MHEFLEGWKLSGGNRTRKTLNDGDTEIAPEGGFELEHHLLKEIRDVVEPNDQKSVDNRCESILIVGSSGDVGVQTSEILKADAEMQSDEVDPMIENAALRETNAKLVEQGSIQSTQLSEKSEQLEKMSLIMEKMGITHAAERARWDSQIFEVANQLKATKIALKVSDAALKSLPGHAIVGASGDREALDMIVDMQAKRIKNLEASLSSKSRVIDHIADGGADLDDDDRRPYLSCITPLDDDLALRLSILKSSQRELSDNLADTHDTINRLSAWKGSLLAGKRRYSTIHSNPADSLETQKEDTLLGLAKREDELKRDSKRLVHDHDYVGAQIKKLEEISRKQSGASKPPQPKKDEGFVFLEDLLTRLQPEQSLRDSMAPTSVINGSSRFSIMSSDPSTANADIDSTVLGQLLYASKSRIQHLKTMIVSLRTSNESLQSELDEANNHLADTYTLLRTANHKSTGHETRIVELQSALDGLNYEMKTVENDRISELELLYSKAVSLVGNEEGEAQASGLLALLDAAILNVDPAFKAKITAATPEAGDFDASILNRQESQATTPSVIHESVLSFADALMQGFKEANRKIGVINSLLTLMSHENKKYVKEIVRMRNASLLKSFIKEVKESDAEAEIAAGSIEKSALKSALEYKNSIGMEVKDEDSQQLQSFEDVVKTEKEVQGLLDSLQAARNEISMMDKADTNVVATKQAEYKELVRTLMQKMKNLNTPGSTVTPVADTKPASAEQENGTLTTETTGTVKAPVIFEAVYSTEKAEEKPARRKLFYTTRRAGVVGDKIAESSMDDKAGSTVRERSSLPLSVDSSSSVEKERSSLISRLRKVRKLSRKQRIDEFQHIVVKERYKEN